MPVLRCRTCRKSIDIDPVKCPYCGVVQPNTVPAPALRPVQLAVLLVAGLGFGVPTGSRLGRRPSPAPAFPLPAQARTAAAGFEAEARRRAHGLGPYRLVEVEDLYLAPEKLFGKMVAVPGLVQKAKIGPDGARVELASQWSSQARVGVDVGGLTPEYQKALIKRQDAYHVYLVKGEVLRGDLAPGGRGCLVRAQEIEPLGEAADLDGPKRAAKIMREEVTGR